MLRATGAQHNRLHTQVYKQAELLSQHLFLFHQKARGKAAIANPLLSREHTQAWSRTSCWPSSQPMCLCVLGMEPSPRVWTFWLWFPLWKSSLILAPSS